jgi:hypothetical protein
MTSPGAPVQSVQTTETARDSAIRDVGVAGRRLRLSMRYAELHGNDNQPTVMMLPGSNYGEDMRGRR